MVNFKIKLGFPYNLVCKKRRLDTQNNFKEKFSLNYKFNFENREFKFAEFGITKNQSRLKFHIEIRKLKIMILL